MANATLARRRVKGINRRLEDVILNGQKFKAHAEGQVLSAEVERTIEGASTIQLDLHDPRQVLLESKLFKTSFDVELDGLWFRFVALNKSDDTLSLTLEDRPVAYMRLYKTPKKVLRKKMTRAEFVKKLVREVKEERIPLYIKELHKEQPIADSRQVARAEIDLTDKRGAGLDEDASLTAKGAPADRGQLQLGDTALRISESHNAPKAAQIALIAALIVESLIRNLAGGTSSSVGGLQLLDIHGSVEQRMDFAWTVSQFLEKGFTGRGGAIALANQGMDPASIAQAVQGAASPTYGQYVGEATKWVDAFGGGTATDATGTATYSKEKQYSFERKKGEDTWDATGRLAEEVKWRRFMSAGVFYYVAEDDLYRQPPMMYVREEGVDGIDRVNFDWDGGKKVTEVNITGRVAAWAAPPGTIVKLGKKFGPAKGKYLVSTIRTSLFNDNFDITLKTPTPSIPEPAAEQVNKSVSFGENPLSSVGGTSGKASTGQLSSVRIPSTAAGAPSWGGAAYVFKDFIHDFMSSRGLSIGGQKEEGHTEDGDHDPSSTTSYACDYGTTSGASAANALGNAMGRGGSSVGTFASFNCQVDGHTYRVQILWAVEGHYDHVHVGLRLV